MAYQPSGILPKQKEETSGPQVGVFTQARLLHARFSILTRQRGQSCRTLELDFTSASTQMVGVLAARLHH